MTNIEDYAPYIIMALLFIAVIVIVIIAMQPKILSGWVSGIFNVLRDIFNITKFPV